MESGFSIPWGYTILSKKELKEFIEKAELLPIYEKQFRHMTEHALELEDKLEAVKMHLKTWVSGHSDWQMGRMSQWKKELEKLLEAS